MTTSIRICLSHGFSAHTDPLVCRLSSGFSHVWLY